MIDTQTTERIIFKRAEGKSYRKIENELGLKSDNPIVRIERQYKDKIGQKRVEITKKTDTLSEKLLFYTKNRLLALLKDDKSISGNTLSNIYKTLDTIQRLDSNKPTSITDSKKLHNATTTELLNEYQERLNTIRSHS